MTSKQLRQGNLEQITEVYKRMFIGLLLEFRSEIWQAAYFWQHGQDKDKDNGGKRPCKKEFFTQSPLDDETKQNIEHLLEKAKKGILPVPRRGDENYSALADEFRNAQKEHLFFTLELVKDITASLIGKNAGNTEPHYLRNYGELHGLLQEYVKLHKNQLKKSCELKNLLEKRSHICELERPLDLMYNLAKKPAFGKGLRLHGWSVRRKTADRIAMKVAADWYNLMKKYDMAIKSKREGNKNTGKEDAHDFKVDYGDILITDMAGFSLIVPPMSNYNWDFLAAHNLTSLEYKDEKEDKIGVKELRQFGLDDEEYTQQHRLKLLHRAGFIIDLHINDIVSVITRLFGARSHYKYVLRKHEERRRDSRRIRKAGENSPYKTYGQFYNAVYKAALEFFNDCRLASIEPTEIRYHAAANKQQFLARELDKITNGESLKLKPEDCIYFEGFLEKLWLDKKKACDNGKRHLLMHMESTNEEKDKKIKCLQKKFELPIYGLFSCYMHEFNDLFDIELGYLLRIKGKNVEFDEQAQRIFKGINILAGLYTILYGRENRLSRKIEEYIGRRKFLDTVIEDARDFTETTQYFEENTPNMIKKDAERVSKRKKELKRYMKREI